MKLLIQSTVIFFGTLTAAAAAALGEPAQTPLAKLAIPMELQT